jgi:phosphoribosylamine--glycine ligase
MGSYSPVPWLEEDLIRKAEERVVEPILRAMADRGIDFRGVLFSGLIADGEELYCIEYNVRFGDPEIQSIVPRLGGGFSEALLSCAKGAPIPPLELLDNAVVTVVIASGGYPGAYEKGKRIEIDSIKTQNAVLFHAGTSTLNEGLVTAGGRVIAVTAVAEGLEDARKEAYEAVAGVAFEGMQFRSDIASNL